MLLATSKIVVREAKVAGKRKDNTKTNVVREVILNSRAMEALQRQRKHTQLTGQEVFIDPRFCEPWETEQSFRRHFWTQLLVHRGIRYRRPYNMRHTYATTMLMAGMTPAFCAKQLGNSVQVFLTTYAKWIDGNQNQLEMVRLEASLAIAPGMPPSVKAGPTSS